MLEETDKVSLGPGSLLQCVIHLFKTGDINKTVLLFAICEAFFTTKMYDLCDYSFWLNISGILYEQKLHVALFDSFFILFSIKTLMRQYLRYFHLRVN